jgi:hypothetical protein
MKGAKILKGFWGFFFLINIPGMALASKGDPVCKINLNLAAFEAKIVDSLPPPQEKTESPKEKKAESQIKEVPKARRQEIPVPVVNIKPVKIIKPKIKVIKPVIKILH